MSQKIKKIKVIPIIDKNVRILCLRPYYNHNKGCPNFNKRKTCPPQAPLWNEICNIKLETYIYYTKFNLKEHIEKMKIKHPNWSQYQLSCCLYWQNKARKPLNDFIKNRKNFEEFITLCPEAMGINVTKTMKNIGIQLEWPPRHWVYQVAMSGKLMKGRK